MVGRWGERACSILPSPGVVVTEEGVRPVQKALYLPEGVEGGPLHGLVWYGSGGPS